MDWKSEQKETFEWQGWGILEIIRQRADPEKTDPRDTGSPQSGKKPIEHRQTRFLGCVRTLMCQMLRSNNLSHASKYLSACANITQCRPNSSEKTHISKIDLK